MEQELDLIRAFARVLLPERLPPPACFDDVEAARLTLQVTRGDRCPRCGAGARVIDRRTARCEGGHRFSITAGTPLQRTKLRLSHWLLAVWHLHVDLEPLSARAFSRRYRLRHATAWALMHRVRRAFISTTPRHRGSSGRIARRNGVKTAPVIAASRDGESLVLVEEAVVGSPGGARSAPETSAILGRARAWLTTVFCGVTERYLHLYLDEFVDRFGRRARTPWAKEGGRTTPSGPLPAAPVL